MLSYLIAVHLRLSAATPCNAGTFANAEPVNHFTADCAGEIDHNDTCVLTISPGYAGGSVMCDTADGVYDVVKATGVSSNFL